MSKHPCIIYQCGQCDYNATNTDNLTKHQLEHLEEDHSFQESAVYTQGEPYWT